MEDWVKLFDRLVSHRRVIFAIFVACGWALYRGYQGDEFDVARPSHYFWLGLVFTGALLLAHLGASIRDAIARNMREADDTAKQNARYDQVAKDIIGVIPTLDREQRITCIYCRRMNLKTFQAWANDPVLHSLSMLRMLECGPELPNEKRVYRFFEFVWEHLPTQGRTELEDAAVRTDVAPWDERHRRGGGWISYG